MKAKNLFIFSRIWFNLAMSWQLHDIRKLYLMFTLLCVDIASLRKDKRKKNENIINMKFLVLVVIFSIDIFFRYNGTCENCRRQFTKINYTGLQVIPATVYQQ